MRTGPECSTIRGAAPAATASIIGIAVAWTSTPPVTRKRLDWPSGPPNGLAGSRPAGSMAPSAPRARMKMLPCCCTTSWPVPVSAETTRPAASGATDTRSTRRGRAADGEHLAQIRQAQAGRGLEAAGIGQQRGIAHSARQAARQGGGHGRQGQRAADRLQRHHGLQRAGIAELDLNRPRPVRGHDRLRHHGERAADRVGRGLRRGGQGPEGKEG